VAVSSIDYSEFLDTAADPQPQALNGVFVLDASVLPALCRFAIISPEAFVRRQRESSIPVSEFVDWC
jgi:hypothetical protein